MLLYVVHTVGERLDTVKFLSCETPYGAQLNSQNISHLVRVILNITHFNCCTVFRWTWPSSRVRAGKHALKELALEPLKYTLECKCHLHQMRHPPPFEAPVCSGRSADLYSRTGATEARLFSPSYSLKCWHRVVLLRIHNVAPGPSLRLISLDVTGQTPGLTFCWSRGRHMCKVLSKHKQTINNVIL